MGQPRRCRMGKMTTFPRLNPDTDTGGFLPVLRSLSPLTPSRENPLLGPSESDSLRRREFLGVGAATFGAAWLAACGRDVAAPVIDPFFARRPPTGTRN